MTINEHVPRSVHVILHGNPCFSVVWFEKNPRRHNQHSTRTTVMSLSTTDASRAPAPKGNTLQGMFKKMREEVSKRTPQEAAALKRKLDA